MSPTTKERPILFSAPMVRALLAGTKTQTRRIIKAPFTDISNSETVRWLKEWDCFAAKMPGGGNVPLTCPYGQPGDRLWVRETWSQPGGRYRYRAEDPDRKGVNRDVNVWCPSIHMPRAASRITLEITDIRVERLNDISEQDAKAEGVAETIHDMGWNYSRPWACGYKALWESINGAGSWAANPWVWALTFRRVKP